MKKILRICILIIVVVIGMGIYIRPIKMTHIINQNKDCYIDYIDVSKSKDNKTKQYYIEKKSSQMESFINILENYTYHKGLKTVIPNQSLKTGTLSFTIQINSGDNFIVLSSSGEMSVNEQVYYVGYGGEEKVKGLMNRLIEELNEKEKKQINNYKHEKDQFSKNWSFCKCVYSSTIHKSHGSNVTVSFAAMDFPFTKSYPFSLL